MWSFSLFKELFADPTVIILRFKTHVLKLRRVTYGFSLIYAVTCVLPPTIGRISKLDYDKVQLELRIRAQKHFV